jgi:hypothetical protein
VFVVVESAAALEPLKSASRSLPDPIAVEWAVANALQAAGRLERVYPLLLGDVDQVTRERAGFSAWGGGSDDVVVADDVCVARALGLAAGTNSTLTSRQTVSTVNQNQGQKVGGPNPDFTLSTAASKIHGMISADAQGQEVVDQLQKTRALLTGALHRLEETEGELEAMRRELEVLRSAPDRCARSASVGAQQTPKADNIGGVVQEGIKVEGG